MALRLGRDVDQATAAGLDEAGASALIDAMAVSIEVVDSRWQECMQAPPLMRLADLQCHGDVVPAGTVVTTGTWVVHSGCPGG